MIFSSNNRLNLIRTLSCCQCYAPPPSQATLECGVDRGGRRTYKRPKSFNVDVVSPDWQKGGYDRQGSPRHHARHVFIGDKLADDEWQAKLKLGKMCSTTGSNASVKTMTRYLDEIYKWAYINQIPLITPDELKWVRN